MSEYSDDGKVALWANESANEKAPKYKGHAFAHRDIKKGEKVSVALWQNEPGDRRPVFRGKIEDIRQRSDDAATVAPATPVTTEADLDDFRDGVPF